MSTGNERLKKQRHAKEFDNEESEEKGESWYWKPHDKDTSKDKRKEEHNNRRIRFEDDNSGSWRNKGRLKITVKNKSGENRNRLEGMKGSTSKIDRNHKGNSKDKISRLKNYPSASEDEEEYGFWTLCWIWRPFTEIYITSRCKYRQVD